MNTYSFYPRIMSFATLLTRHWASHAIRLHTRRPCTSCTASPWPPHITTPIQTTHRTCSGQKMRLKCFNGACPITLSRTTITQGRTPHTCTGAPLGTPWGSGGIPQGCIRSLEAHTTFLYMLPVSKGKRCARSAVVTSGWAFGPATPGGAPGNTTTTHIPSPSRPLHSPHLRPVVVEYAYRVLLT